MPDHPFPLDRRADLPVETRDDSRRRTAAWRAARYPELEPLARRQAGVLTLAQLRARGWSRHRTHREVGAGRWIQVAPRVVALQNAPLVRAQLMWLGVLHAGADAVLTHGTASEMAGLRAPADATVHVLSAKSDEVAPLPGFRFHQTRRRYLDWVDRAADGPPRLRVQHAALLTAERDHRLRRAIGLLAAHVQQGLCTVEELLDAAVQIRKLRHGALFRLALADIAGGAQSFAEIAVGRLCADAGLQAPRRQRVRLDRDGRRRFLDCEWVLPDGGVVVLEVDGSFHMRTEHWWRDMPRERAVVVSGSRVLRCSSVELRLDPDAVVADLVAVGVPSRFPPRFVRGHPA